MNRTLVLLILGMIFVAGCGQKGADDSQEVEVDTQINTSSVDESETGIDVGEIEEQINESDDLFSDW
jgi:hypothetical protein